MDKDEELKVRIPGELKRALHGAAKMRFKSLSELAREAIFEYLQNHPLTKPDFAAFLRETPEPYGTKVNSPKTSAQVDQDVVAIVTGKKSGAQKPYRKPRTAAKKPQ